MVFYPAATRKLIPENDTAPFLATPDRRPTTAIYHSAVGRGSLYDYFKQTGVKLESHCWIGLEGQVEQYVDFQRRADANYKANAFAASWETADNGHPDSFEWTTDQCNSIVASMLWQNEMFGIPLRICPSWDAPGFGFHTLFGAPSNWTPVSKTCPGTVRKKQFPVLLGAAKELKRLKENPPVPDFDINTPVPVTGSAKTFIEARGGDVGKDNEMPYSWFVVWNYINAVQIREELMKQTSLLNQQPAAIANLLK